MLHCRMTDQPLWECPSFSATIDWNQSWICFWKTDSIVSPVDLSLHVSQNLTVDDHASVKFIAWPSAFSYSCLLLVESCSKVLFGFEENTDASSERLNEASKSNSEICLLDFKCETCSCVVAGSSLSLTLRTLRSWAAWGHLHKSELR